MSLVSKRELQKLHARIDLIYSALDGVKKQKVASSNDEFANLQTRITEECVALRKLIREREGLDKTAGKFIELNKMKGQITAKFEELDLFLAQMEAIKKDKAALKAPAELQNQREEIVSKLKSIVANLRAAAEPNAARPPSPKKNLTLKDMASWGGSNNATYMPETTEADLEEIEKWRVKDQALDMKLDDVGNLLDDLRERNKKLTAELDKREVLLVDTGKGAAKLAKMVEIQNHKVAEILQKFRSPQQLCMDFCLILLLLGLTGMVVMMIKNGK